MATLTASQVQTNKRVSCQQHHRQPRGQRHHRWPDVDGQRAAVGEFQVCLEMLLCTFDARKRQGILRTDSVRGQCR
jgi:hypothetical protein